MSPLHASAAKKASAKAATPVMRKSAPPPRHAVPPLASLAAIPANVLVQRQCASCEQEEEVKESAIQRRLAATAAAPAPQRACTACEEKEKEESAVQPRLEVGPVGDRYEQEADSIAARVMAMPDPAAADLAGDASSAGGSVQRACSACSALRDEPRARRLADGDETEEDAGIVRARRDGGAETLAASDAQLTSGGSALPASTRGFFESRMGRDLGGVRVHQGGQASAMNASIAARAFTYKNHVWLSAGESASPSFTMAHELAHVMQQTAPGPVGPQRRAAEGGDDAHAADAAVQRKENVFWLPGITKNAKGLHETMHDAALDAIRAIRGDILTEVPIPGANRKLAEVGAQGRADIYTADADPDVKVPGVQQVVAAAPAVPPPAAGDPPAADPAAGGTDAKPAGTPPAGTPVATIADLDNFSPVMVGVPMEQGSGKPATVVHDTRRAPKIAGGQLTGVASAPKNILIGEMKPAHDLDYRKSGEQQVANYIGGITAVAAKVNAVAGSLRQNAEWKPNPKVIDTSTLIPSGWDASKSQTVWKEKNLKIRHYSPDKAKTHGGKPKPKAQTAQQGRPKTQPIRGRWMMAPDKAHKGVIVYFLAPHPGDLADALKPRSTTQKFKDLTGKIKKIQNDLVTAPKASAGGAAVKPRRVAQPVPVAAAAPLGAATALPARIARKEVKDDFKAAKWEADRTGAGLAKGAADNSLLADYADAADDTLREDIAEHGAMAEWLKTKPETPGTTYEDKPEYKQHTEDLATIKRADFWTGLKARPFGILREKFGMFFVKAYKAVATFGKSVRDKFKGVGESDILKGRTGTVLKAAAKVAAVVLPRLVKPFMAKMIDTIIECGRLGFEAKFRELIEGTVIEDVIQTAEEMKEKVEQIASDVETFFDTMIAKAMSPIHDEFKKFMGDAQLAMDVAKIIAEITKLMRIGSCVAGLVSAPATVGVGAAIGCGAALGDYILSKFGLSPVEHLVASMLHSCEMQNKVGVMMAKLNFVRTLPKFAGVAVIKEVKSLLKNSQALANLGTLKGKTYAEHASGLFCDPKTIESSFPDMGYEPSDCSDTGPFRQSKTGTYDIPDDEKIVPRYKETNPTPAKELPWKGVEIPKGREGELNPMPADEVKPPAPAVPPPDDKKPPKDDKPATDKPTDAKPPETTPPAPGDGKAPAAGVPQGGTTPAEKPDRIEEGHIANAKPTKIVLAIYGGFDPKTPFDGTQLRGAYLAGTASDGTVYGPVLVDIYVHQLIMEKPYWRIRFKFKLADPKKNLVLTDGQTNNQLELYDSDKIFTTRWRSQAKLPKPADATK
jgi:D-ribose pyranose/furanose isomerase RbsD